MKQARQCAAQRQQCQKWHLQQYLQYGTCQSHVVFQSVLGCPRVAHIARVAQRALHHAPRRTHRVCTGTLEPREAWNGMVRCSTIRHGGSQPAVEHRTAHKTLWVGGAPHSARSQARACSLPRRTYAKLELVYVVEGVEDAEDVHPRLQGGPGGGSQGRGREEERWGSGKA